MTTGRRADATRDNRTVAYEARSAISFLWRVGREGTGVAFPAMRQDIDAPAHGIAL